MSKIRIFYREFFIILALLILFFGLFGTINDRVVQLITNSSTEILLEKATFYKILFTVQATGLLASIYIIYRNGIPFKRKGKKLTKKAISILLTISFLLIFIPYAVLILV